MWKGKGRSGYGESSTLGDYDDWSCLSRNGRQWKNPITMLTRDLSGADYWHMRKQLTDSYDVPEELHAVNETVSLAHTLPSGKANLLAYADRPVKPKSSVSLKDRILPQAKRVRLLTEQLYELEAERKNGLDILTYSQLRDVLICKRDRAEVLLKKALSVHPIRPETYEDEGVSSYASSDHPSDNNGHGESYSSPVGVSFIDEVIDGLSNDNSLKSFLKMSCKVVRKVVQFSHKAKSYWNELKAV